MNPLPSCTQNLPSTSTLCESPQLASLAILQATLRLVSQVLDIHHHHLGSLDNLAPDADTPEILAQLITDRSRELSELVTCYRLNLDVPRSSLNLVEPDDFPF